MQLTVWLALITGRTRYYLVKDRVFLFGSGKTIFSWWHTQLSLCGTKLSQTGRFFGRNLYS